DAPSAGGDPLLALDSGARELEHDRLSLRRERRVSAERAPFEGQPRVVPALDARAIAAVDRGLVRGELEVVAAEDSSALARDLGAPAESDLGVVLRLHGGAGRLDRGVLEGELEVRLGVDADARGAHELGLLRGPH